MSSRSRHASGTTTKDPRRLDRTDLWYSITVSAWSRVSTGASSSGSPSGYDHPREAHDTPK